MSKIVIDKIAHGVFDFTGSNLTVGGTVIIDSSGNANFTTITTNTYLDLTPMGSVPAAVTGRIYFNNTLNKAQLYDGSSWKDFGIDPNVSITWNGLQTFKAGARYDIALSDPAAPNAVPVGTAGTTSRSYYIVAKDANGKRTNVSPVKTITNSNATLTGTNYVQITWTAVAGAASYDVLVTNTSTSLALNVVGTSLNHTGQATGVYVPPNRNETAGDITVDAKLDLNSMPNGRLVLPVGTNKYAL